MSYFGYLFLMHVQKGNILHALYFCLVGPLIFYFVDYLRSAAGTLNGIFIHFLELSAKNEIIPCISLAEQTEETVRT